MANPALVTYAIPPSFFDKRDDTALAWLGMAGVLLNACAEPRPAAETAAL
jgi:hypothetical protein